MFETTNQLKWPDPTGRIHKPRGARNFTKRYVTLWKKTWEYTKNLDQAMRKKTPMEIEVFQYG